MRIARIESGSVAERAGVRTGDDLLAIDGVSIRDGLDFVYASAEEDLRLRLQHPDGESEEIAIHRAPGEPLGIELSPDPIRRCGNRCIFCFIDQNPKGLRPSLYVKDEDYRHSLLYGNYLTMTNLQVGEISRIIEQRLSPLYVSVHAVQPAIRKSLLCCPGDGEIIPLLRRLTRGGIELHAQIVVVPEHNDGDVLEETLDALESLHPGLQSVAIVPVGLTRHREGLAALRRVTPEEARRLVRAVSKRQEQCLKEHATRLHFLADEFYLLAGLPLPSEEAYEGFPQLENGVGMVRRFESDYRGVDGLMHWEGGGSRPERPGDGARERPRVVLVTGTRFGPLLTRWLRPVLEATGEAARFDVRVAPVKNRFFGTGVTTAGLLTGQDIAASLEDHLPFELAVLPPETLNNDSVMLDGMSPRQLALQLDRPLQIGFAGAARVVS